MLGLDFLASSRRHGVLGYAVAVVAFLAAYSNIVLLQTAAPFATLVLAVIVSTWFGGSRPGMLAAALSIPVLVYVLAPAPSPAGGTGQLSRVLYFLAIAGFVIWVIVAERSKAAVLRRDIDALPAMAWTMLPDGRLDFLNRRWLDYTGLSLRQAIAQANSIVHPDDLPRVMEKWREIQTSGEPFDNEMRLRRADGEYRWFLVRTVPVRDARGRILRWYGTSTDIEDRKQAESRLQELSRRLLEVQEEERRHLARELHDEFGQLLAGVSLHLHAARGAAGEVARTNLDRCAALLERAGTRVRSLALELRPTMLDSAGLDAALRWLAEQHEQQTGMAVQIAGEADEVALEVAIVCFRIAQEALTNIVRHARARHAWIELGRRDDALELAVRDDGVGFEVAATVGQAGASGRLGLLGMRERVQILGGSLQVDSRPGGGTTIRISLPLRPAQRVP